MARDYRTQYKDKCLTCKKYDIYTKSNATVRGFRCDRLMRPVAMSEHCYQYDFDAIRGNWEIEEAVEWILKRGYDPRPDCYVVTAMCEILDIPYDSEYIENFKIMRDEYMCKTEAGRKQLAAYDLYGIQIADRLRQDYANEKTRVATGVKVKTIILPAYEQVNELIKCNNFGMAVYTYFQMIKTIAKFYNINHMVPVQNAEAMCQECGEKLNK